MPLTPFFKKLSFDIEIKINPKDPCKIKSIEWDGPFYVKRNNLYYLNPNEMKKIAFRNNQITFQSGELKKIYFAPDKQNSFTVQNLVELIIDFTKLEREAIGTDKKTNFNSGDLSKNEIKKKIKECGCDCIDNLHTFFQNLVYKKKTKAYVLSWGS